MVRLQWHSGGEEPVRLLYSRALRDLQKQRRDALGSEWVCDKCANNLKLEDTFAVILNIDGHLIRNNTVHYRIKWVGWESVPDKDRVEQFNKYYMTEAKLVQLGTRVQAALASYQSTAQLFPVRDFTVFEKDLKALQCFVGCSVIVFFDGVWFGGKISSVNVSYQNDRFVLAVCDPTAFPRRDVHQTCRQRCLTLWGCRLDHP